MQFILSLFLLLFLLTGCLPGALEVTHTSEKVKYETGELKKLIYIKKQQYKTDNLFSFYEKVVSRTIEFYKDSTIKSTGSKITKRGDGGSGCLLVMERLTEFHPNGEVKKKFLKRCDGKRTITKYYSTEGKLIFTQIEKKVLQ